MSTATEITQLEMILNTGATTVVVDGQKVTYDLAAVRKRLRELRRRQNPGKRPVVSSINLSNF